MYRQLDPAKIDQTAIALRRRIVQYFPDSGLSKVCVELEAVIEETEARCRWIAEPKLWLRLLIALLILLVVGSLVATAASLGVSTRIADQPLTLGEVIQTLEAGINDVVLIGLAVVFLVSVENRIKRSRALKGLHELRAIAHVIDMHQLTKDPELLLAGSPPGQGEAEPVEERAEETVRPLGPFRLVRYLDYCSEMLALTAKTAALYGQYLEDPAILASVTEIEDLTTNLSRKIWQKISLVELYQERVEIRKAQTAAVPPSSPRGSSGASSASSLAAAAPASNS